ncbi:hypothetical protein, partial [Bradyrhizobium yuanmingense]
FLGVGGRLYGERRGDSGNYRAVFVVMLSEPFLGQRPKPPLQCGVTADRPPVQSSGIAMLRSSGVSENAD